MISLHTIETALLTLSFNYSTIRHATKCVDAWNSGDYDICEPVTAGNVELRRANDGCFVTIQRIADSGHWEYVTVAIPDNGDDFKTYTSTIP